MAEVGGSTGSGTGFNRDLTKGNVFSSLLSLSWPVMISNSLNMLGPTIDMVWVGKLGPAAIAGVGVAGMAVVLVNSAVLGLSMGLRAIVARFVGAGDISGAVHAVRQGFVVVAIFSTLIAIIGIFFTEFVLSLMGMEADVVVEGAPYMRILFVAVAAMSFRMMTEATMQASGDVVTPMKLAIIFRILHVALAPFLIFGWWIFPEMGVSGAAITNVISQSFGLSLGLWFLFSGRTRLRLNMNNFRIDLNIIWRIVRIGIPASVMTAQATLGQLILMRLVAPFGTLAVAAHSLVQRVELFFFMPSMAFGMAAGVLAGQNLGAGQPERAEKSGWLAVALAESFMIICSIVILLWAESIVSVFNADPELVKMTSTFMRIAVAGYLVMGFVGALMQCLSGAGDTVPPMIFGLVILWAVQVPLAYFLPRITDLGVYGIRWAMSTGLIVGAVAYVTYFRLGRWKRKRV
ncbi:MATE family efflux transporter [Chloroflexota bacterium]